MIFDVDVIVVGAGPAGLLLAGDLARAGVPGNAAIAPQIRDCLARWCGSPAHPAAAHAGPGLRLRRI